MSLPPLPTPVKNGWMDCEDCDGRGAVGEPIYQGEFQPPECEPCSSCNGSGRWKVPLVTTQQAQAYGDARAAAAVLAEQKKAERLRAKLQEIGDFAASCATGPGLREALAMIEQMVAAPGEQQP